MLLYRFGSGPVKGFAVTLSIGIVTSLFTAVMRDPAADRVTGCGRAGRPKRVLHLTALMNWFRSAAFAIVPTIRRIDFMRWHAHRLCLLGAV